MSRYRRLMTPTETNCFGRSFCIVSDNEATATDRWPLNESQRRALAITLAGIERDLGRLAEVRQRPPTDGRMIRHVEPPVCSAEQAAQLVARIHEEIGRLADDLQLPPQEESLTRSLTSALLLDEVAVEEVGPRRLRAYGAVHPQTADYLHRRLPVLRERLRQLGELLAAGREEG
jgi:hypothetical protein